PGDVFVAVRGLKDDGTRHVGDALARGAVAVVTAPDAAAPDTGAWVVAEDVRLAAARLAARAWGNPSERLAVLGVTGTNGKTTTTWLLRSIWDAAGKSCAVMGTLGAHLPQGTLPQARTTPEAPELQEAFAKALEQGATAAAVEVSSHALDLRRVDGTRFAAAAFLNLSPEHLDWHGTMEAYGASKLRLFRELLAPGYAAAGPRAIVNGKDPWADRVRDVVEGVLAFRADGEDAEVTAHGVRPSEGGSAFTLVTPGGEAEVTLPLPGIHNVENALAAASLAYVMGIGTKAVARGLSEAAPPPGRFERVHGGSFSAYVDYAHTEDGVRLALAAARHVAGGGRVIAVLGCGGERDQAKRPGMGRAAAELADVAVFTTDNPRSEDPAAIVEEMQAGAADCRDRVQVVMDREEALDFAVREARPGDVVIALGKGHESVQIVGGVNHPFPEREILARLAARRDGDTG
ncbi:MAG TPA: UDP-N-acetylmuramoyl-L-alanyl-D-glutamate--2,6-diaminopimelate ligase, partial [bacterium]|nr:UDP-N-acetylmuramoyl-L-alanyl-D-glutamate--2,6-diaminopimelate ligase [bacterium]